MRAALAGIVLAALCTPIGAQVSSARADAGSAVAHPASAPNGAIEDPYLAQALGRQSRQQSSHTAGDSPAPSSTSSLITVEILHDGSDYIESSVKARVEALGGRVTGTAPGRIVEASVPTEAIVELQRTSGVSFVRLPRPVNVRPFATGVVDAGPLTTEGVSITNASAWQAAGFTGAGVKVGIIDFFNLQKWNTQLAAGEVPPVSGTFCLEEAVACAVWDPRETGHGNAVAEVIHDMAPDAQIYLGQASTISDSFALVRWFAANGVTIVNRSLGSTYDGPGDGTGPLDDLVDYAAGRGITWFNSAGNEGNRQYWRGTWQDADNDGWLDFTPGDESLNIINSDNCVSILGARWNDWGTPATRTDYDFYIYAGDQQVFPVDAAFQPIHGPDQQSGAPPIELDGIEGCESKPLSVRVKKRADGSGTAGDVLELLTYGGELEYSQAAGSADGPIVDSRNRAVLAVGAIDPANGGANAYYSSQGPTNDGRRKPDLTAPSCFISSIYRALNSCFNGTSAASPAAAGLAAVVRSSGLSVGPQGLAALMKHLVIDRGSPGPDNVYGTGEIRLPEPPAPPTTSAPAAYTAITPTRVVDTRRGLGPIAHPLEPEEILDVQMAGVGPVPANASSVALNVTTVGARTPGYLQVLPTMSAAIDGFSSLNLESVGQVLPNFVISPVSANGRISIYSPSGGDVLVDVLGYFVPAGPPAGVAAGLSAAAGPTAEAGAGRFVPLTPHRVLDTRQQVELRPDVLPVNWTNHKPASREVVVTDFKPSSGVPSSGVSAVVLSVTATAPDTDGYVTIFPSGSSPPDASSINVVAGGTNANSVIVPLGPDGRVALFTSASAHLIVDVAGFITDATAPAEPSGLFVPITPARIYDTRSAGTLLASGVVRTIPAGGLAGIPSTQVGALSFNATVAATTGANGYLQLSPAAARTTTEFSNVNWNRPDEIIAIGGLVKLGTNAAIDARTFQSAHLIVDANGYFTGE